MKQTSLLQQIRPRSHPQWRALPIIGPLLDEFLRWLQDKHYTLLTIASYLQVLPKLVDWLHRRRIKTLSQLTHQDLQLAYDQYRPGKQAPSWVIGALDRFLCECHLVSQGDVPKPTPVEVEVVSFEHYLRQSRGLTETTIHNHAGLLRRFLQFLRIDQHPGGLHRLQVVQVEGFLRQSARTNNRFSLQHIVATIRAFLRWQHAQGVLSRPLHLRIDTPRVYRGERLPRALPWARVQALLQSIDRSDPFGRRDFTILYLAAAYGLRSSELVRLTLDDIDWRGRNLRIIQTKTRQSIQLPLSDEAANVLIGYLRKARPKSPQRHLFMRMRAPIIPLKPASVSDLLDHRIRCSGLDLPPFGTHVLRHSFAMRLMQQGATIKTIGDTLGHRDIESTSIYLRLNVDDLREVALPAPAIPPTAGLELVPCHSVPRTRPPRPRHNLPVNFHSRLAPSLQRFVDLKRIMGRRYVAETVMLRHWDDFVFDRYPRAAKVHAEMFANWTKTLVTMSSTGALCFVRIVRNFLLFHARDHVGTFIPDRLTFPKAAPIVSPRLISEAEMGRVLAVALQLPPSADNPLRAETLYIGLILLFCCGLRRGELLRLTLADLQAEQTLLYVRLTKFRKSRLVPLSPSVTVELRGYLKKRSQMKLPMAGEAFLMWSRQRSPEVYAGVTLGLLWHQLCASAKVLDAQGHPPRVHDLRHSAAVLMLQRWYDQGVDVQAKLPHLATYLGHVNAVSTHHYLKLTPELGQAASQRFHQRFAPLLTAGGVA